MKIVSFPKIYLFLFFVGIFFGTPVVATEVVLNVPFTAQAPEGKWVEPWDNACEEASIIMVENYYRGNWDLSVNKSKTDIESLLEKKNNVFGKTKDESSEKIVQMIKNFYNRDASVENNITVEKIKSEIDGGYPVIISYDTRLVNNPNFIDPKPTYHVGVIVGYDDETQDFLVNDPGTSEGRRFRYSYKELLLANKEYTLHDSGETRGGDAVFTSSIFLGGKGFFAKFFEVIRTWLF